MSQRNIERTRSSRSPIVRNKSPIYLSPRARLKQQTLVTENTGYSTDNPSACETILKSINIQPLEFSSNRKLKPKVPLLSCFPIVPYGQVNQNGNSSMAANSQVSSANADAYHAGNYSNHGSNFGIAENTQNHVSSGVSRYYNENKWSEGAFKTDRAELIKLRNSYENEIRTLLDLQKHLKDQLQTKIRAIQREKSYWKQSYTGLKDEFDAYVKNIQIILNEKKKEVIEGAGLESQNKIKQQLQQRLDSQIKSLKMAQNEIFILNKQKADLTYDLSFYKQQSRKANSKMYQLQYELDQQKRELEVLKDKLRQEKESHVTKHGDIPLVSSFQHGQIAQCESPRRSHSGSKIRSLSSSGSSSCSGSGRHRSRHHRSSSHNGHQRASLSYHCLNSSLMEPAVLEQINMDLSRELDRQKHCYRKLERALGQQNMETMTLGLQLLNAKYAHIVDDQSQQSTEIWAGSANSTSVLLRL